MADKKLFAMAFIAAIAVFIVSCDEQTGQQSAVSDAETAPEMRTAQAPSLQETQPFADDLDIAMTELDLVED